tara:strand:- start:962 stop:2737 length:1776 start_codon:yes stop_codon:yes gene_type:complete
MAYQALLTAKSDYSNFGSMLASAQENVADTNAQNTETTQFYDSYKAQLEGTGLMEGLPAVPLGVENAYSIGKKLYGAYQKSKDLIPRVKDAASKLQSLGEEAIATGRGQLAKGADIIKNSADKLNSQVLDLGNTVSEGGQTLLSSAQDVVSNVESVAKGGINDVMNTAQNEASNILQTARQTGENIVNVSKSYAEESINAAKGSLGEGYSSVLSAGEEAINEAKIQATNLLAERKQNYEDIANKYQSDMQEAIATGGPKPPTPREFTSAAPEEETQAKGFLDFLNKTPTEVSEPAATFSEAVAPSEAGVSNIRKAYTAFSGKAETYQSFSTTKGRGLSSSQANVEATSGEFSAEGLESGDLIQSYASITQNINQKIGGGESLFGKIKNMFSKAPEVKTTGFNAPDINAPVETVGRDITSNMSGAISQTTENISKTAENLANTGKQTVSDITENISGGLKSASESGQRVIGGITDTVENTMSSVSGGAEKLVSEGSQVAENVVGKASAIGDTVGETVGSVASLAAETGEKAVGFLSEAAGLAIPVVGEIGMLGIAIFQGIKGFEDLFKKPAAPVLQTVPQVANIAQSYQSGI